MNIEMSSAETKHQVKHLPAIGVICRSTAIQAPSTSPTDDTQETFSFIACHITSQLIPGIHSSGVFSSALHERTILSQHAAAHIELQGCPLWGANWCKRLMSSWMQWTISRVSNGGTITAYLPKPIMLLIPLSWYESIHVETASQFPE